MNRIGNVAKILNPKMKNEHYVEPNGMNTNLPAGIVQWLERLHRNHQAWYWFSIPAPQGKIN